MDPHNAYPVLGRNAAFPTNATDAKSFAKAYLADLKVSSKGDMKGKVLLGSTKSTVGQDQTAWLGQSFRRILL
jgi:hypothetical protein